MISARIAKFLTKKRKKSKKNYKSFLKIAKRGVLEAAKQGLDSIIFIVPENVADSGYRLEIYFRKRGIMFVIMMVI